MLATPRGRSRVIFLASLVVLVVGDAGAGVDVEAVRAGAKADAKAGNLRTARSKLKSALATLRQSVSKPTKEAAGLLGDLGEIYAGLGQEAEAMASLEEAAEISRVLYGADDPRYGIALDRLADGHVYAGKHAEALAIWKRLLKSMETGLGKSHPGYQFTLKKAADAAMAARKMGGAAKLYRELIEMTEASEGQKPQEGEGKAETLAETRVHYARALADTGKLGPALEQMTRASEAFAASPSAGSIEHAASLNGVAGVLEKLGRNDEALAKMQAAHEMAVAAEGAGSERAGEALRNLNGMRAHVERKRESERQRARSEELKRARHAHDEL